MIDDRWIHKHETERALVAAGFRVTQSETPFNDLISVRLTKIDRDGKQENYEGCGRTRDAAVQHAKTFM